MKKIILSFFAVLPLMVYAQDDLVKKLENNKSDSAKKKFEFKEIIRLDCTNVKAQGSSGTCWSYSTNSFLESEMIRMGKHPVDLAEIFDARNVYIEKADNYIKMHGAISWGDGGECHDVMNMYAKYGAMPQSVYSGLHYGTTKNQFGEMQAVLKGMLDAWVRNPNGKINPNWKKIFTGVLDSYLGKVPKTFEYHGKEYTPKSFADEVVGIHPEDYVELASYTDKPYYEQSIFMVPDNWSFEKVYNIHMHEITATIDHALEKGYTVAWAADVSEKYFSWKNGVAFVPEKEWDDMSEDEQKELFNGPKPERKITAKKRQLGLDNYETTDDHGMHIVGKATDKTGREYYIVKNSWGEKNDYKGYIYVSKNYVLYKTTAILLHKKGLPGSLRSKLLL